MTADELWQQHAQQLPVRVRPLRQETLTSYATRLAAANALARPTILLRALGHPHGNLTQTTMHDYDIALNAPALARLETFTGIPTERLRKALPAINHRANLPGDIPRIKLFRCWGLRRPCDGLRRPGRRPPDDPHPPTAIPGDLRTPPPLARRGQSPDPDRPHRHTGDPHRAPAATSACAPTSPLTPTAGNGFGGNCTPRQTSSRAGSSPATATTPRLHKVWAARHAVLRPWSTVLVGYQPLVYPEAVALAEIITDLNWRRHVAMVQHDIDLKPFFHRVAARLGQPSLFAATPPATATTGIR